MALVDVTAWWRGRLIVAIVDHGLQEGSAAVAEKAREGCLRLGADEVVVIPVAVDSGPGNGGLEAAAREARYAALRQVALQKRAEVILLGHTMDDQAETVLLGLARGSGPRSLAGMSPRRDDLFIRPFLTVRRSDVHAHAAGMEGRGIAIWRDPHNDDPSFTRVRVRQLMPQLAEALGIDPTAALARTADALRSDNEALDRWSENIQLSSCRPTVEGYTISVAGLKDAPASVRTRVIRSVLLDAGVPGGAITRDHILAADGFVSRWRGQGELALPGGFLLRREGPALRLYHPDVAP